MFTKSMSLGPAVILLTFVLSCGGGGGSSSATQDEEGEVSGNENEAPISSVSFDLGGAVGLALVDTTGAGSLALKNQETKTSNFKKVNQDNTLSDAVASGSITVQSFMVAAGNQVYLLLSQPVDFCILVRVNGETNEATCVDSTLSQINWDNDFGDPIQFDGQGNIYYQGQTGDGHTILREKSSGETRDLINDNISLKGFLVMNDGTVFVAGTTSSTGIPWTRIITPEYSLKALLTYPPGFLSRFPDNNIYFGNGGSSPYSVERYLTATDGMDSNKWIGSSANYYNCPISDYACSTPVSIVKTTDSKVYALLGNSDQKMLTQYYPAVSQVHTTVTNITLSKGILTYILLGGFDSQNNNKLVLYDTNADTETDLLGSEDIEVYHLNYLNSDNHQIVMFDGLRFSDNRYVLCQVDLTNNNTLTCSKTDTGKLTDFHLFDDANTIAGGSTSATKTYTIGGSVTGLYGTLVLQNGKDTVTLTQSGPFTFPIAISSNYEVTVQANPLGQTCTVSQGSGTVSDAHVTSISVACSTNAGVIVTVAGGGSSHPGEGELATKVSLHQPTGVAFDAAGNFYFPDFGSRIRRVSTGGIITTIAGTGSLGFSGDGGAATGARLNFPRGIAFDPAGNLYIADSNNHRIRKVDTNGIITTVAGNGVQGFSGDGGGATDAKLNSPWGIAVDGSGNLYFSDSFNYRIRKVDKNGIITTVAGNGKSGYQEDGVAATATGLSTPSGIALDTSGNLYIADSNNHRIRKVDTKGIITTVAGTGTAGSEGDGGLAANAQLNLPQGIAVDTSGNLYIADTSNNRIRRVAANGTTTTVAGNGTKDFSGDGGPAAGAGLNNPYGIVFDASGDLYIADSQNNRIRMVARK